MTLHTACSTALPLPAREGCSIRTTASIPIRQRPRRPGACGTPSPTCGWLLLPGPPDLPNPRCWIIPPNAASGLPLGGFGLQWHPDLSGGAGVPDYYMVYMSQDEATIYEDQAWPSVTNHFNPVAEGGLALDYLDQWFWTVKAVVIGEGNAAAEPPRSFTVTGPPQISVDPVSIIHTLEMGETATRQLTISNPGDLPLDFSLGFTDTGSRDPASASWHPVLLYVVA